MEIAYVSINGFDFEVHGTYSPGEKGKYYENDGGTPDVPPSFEIEKVMYNFVNVYDLIYVIDSNGFFLNEIEQKCIDSLT